MRGSLLRSIDEHTQICRFSLAFRKDVDVIGHEAARWNCKPQFIGGMQKYRTNVRDEALAREVFCRSNVQIVRKYS